MSCCNDCGGVAPNDALYCPKCGKKNLIVMTNSPEKNSEEVIKGETTENLFTRYKWSIWVCLCLVVGIGTSQVFANNEASKQKMIQLSPAVTQKNFLTIQQATQQTPQKPAILLQQDKANQTVAGAKQIIEGSWPIQDNHYSRLKETTSGTIYLDIESVKRREDGVYAVALLVLKQNPTYKAIFTEYVFSPDKKRMFMGGEIFILNNWNISNINSNSWKKINHDTPVEAVCKAAWEQVELQKL